MTQDSQALDPYALVLADLRIKRAQIDTAIKAIEDLRGNATRTAAIPDPGAQEQDASPVPKEGPGAFLGMTVVDATKKLLAYRRQALPNSEIVAALERGGVVLNSVDKLNTVGSILTRRFNQTGDIVRVSRGTWGLQEWYGSRNFRKKAKEAEVPPAAATLNGETVSSGPVTEPNSFSAPADPDDSWAPVDGPIGRSEMEQ